MFYDGKLIRAYEVHGDDNFESNSLGKPKCYIRTENMFNLNPYFYIFGTLFFTVYGQIALKVRLSNLKIKIPDNLTDKIFYLLKLLLDPYIFSAFLSAFIAALFWMAAMTKFEITYAYPFMSLAPAIVFVIGMLFLGETFTVGKIVGLGIIMLGIIVTVKY